MSRTSATFANTMPVAVAYCKRMGAHKKANEPEA
jgi:hypothetical protein